MGVDAAGLGLFLGSRPDDRCDEPRVENVSGAGGPSSVSFSHCPFQLLRNQVDPGSLWLLLSVRKPQV